MLPMLKYELADKRGWTTEDELLDYYAIGQCTPGIIAVNTATFIGYSQAGVAGGITATLGVVFPSVVIILIVASVLSGIMSNVYLNYALAGIRAGVCALLANTVITLLRKSAVDPFCAVLFVAALAAALFFKVPSIIIVIVSAVLGAVYSLKIKGRKPE